MPRESSPQMRRIIYMCFIGSLLLVSFWGYTERNYMLMRGSPATMASLHQHTECVYLGNPNIQHLPFCENNSSANTQQTTHCRLDIHCKSTLGSKFLKPSTLTTIVSSRCFQTISRLDLYKKQTLIHNKL